MSAKRISRLLGQLELYSAAAAVVCSAATAGLTLVQLYSVTPLKRLPYIIEMPVRADLSAQP